MNISYKNKVLLEETYRPELKKPGLEKPESEFLVLLIRHPPIEQEPGCCYGQTDLPLIEPWGKFVVQWQQACFPIVFKDIYTSPLSRCFKPALQLSEALSLPVQIREELAELNFGEWEKKQWSDIPENLLQAWARSPWDFSPPGGESARSLLARVKVVSDEVKQKAQNCILVTHGGPLRLLPSLFMNTEPDCLGSSLSMGQSRLLSVGKVK